MDSIDAAEEAKNNLNDYYLQEHEGKLTVHFSNLEVLNLQNNNSGGVGTNNLHYFPKKAFP
jgi:hypothetical protein